MRADCLVMGLAAGNSGIHLGGSCSAIEILATLYFGAMRFDPMQSWRLSCATASFSARDMGFRPSTRPSIRWGLVSDADLRTFKQEGSRLTGHPSLGMVEGIDFASGSLGQGLSLGVGTCLALRRKGNGTSRVFVLMGDGECDEGSVWEAAMSAAHYALGNLVAVIDANALQYDGETSRVPRPRRPLRQMARFRVGCGRGRWARRRGARRGVLAAGCAASARRGPRTPVKGKGFSFSENVAAWHHSRLTRDLYDQGMRELGFSQEEANLRAEL